MNWHFGAAHGDKFFNLMFGGGKAKLVLEKPEPAVKAEVEAAEDPEMKIHEKEAEDLGISYILFYFCSCGQ